MTSSKKTANVMYAVIAQTFFMSTEVKGKRKEKCFIQLFTSHIHNDEQQQHTSNFTRTFTR
jgi:hypothetical protein